MTARLNGFGLMGKMNPVIRKIDQMNESEGTVARVRRALTHGLEIAGRKYVFLAAGTSQARSVLPSRSLAEAQLMKHSIRALAGNMGVGSSVRSRRIRNCWSQESEAKWVISAKSESSRSTGSSASANNPYR
jgi:hypothetical protein